MFDEEQAPSYGITEATWERNENQTATFSNDGDADIMEIADPFWTIDVRVAVLSRAHFDHWDSFLARRNLSESSFTIWRSLRVRPRDPLIVNDTGLVITSYNPAASTLTLGGYGAGRAAHYGDMISYRTAANGYWAGQVQAPAVADGAGACTVSVWPRPWAPHAAAPAPKRFYALGEFRLSKKPKVKEGFNDWDIRFEAEQVLR